jgi:stage V sporulation protein B
VYYTTKDAKQKDILIYIFFGYSLLNIHYSLITVAQTNTVEILDTAKQKIDKSMKKSAFLTGALILAVAGILCRVLGVVFRVPLTNIVGNYGMGLYQMVFPLYALLLIVSSAGVPIAISKMVAKERVNGDTQQCKKILINALVLLSAIGLVLTVVLIGLSHVVAGLQGNRGVGIIYIAIAPSILIVCIIAAFRGYFQGSQNMMPTAVSQIIEQGIKLLAGMILAFALIGISVELAVFGAILAVTISELVALTYLMFVYFKNNKSNKSKIKFTKSLDKGLMWEILKQSAPITLMASVFPLILVFDSMAIINMLRAGGESLDAATKLYGIQSGTVHTLINLPAVLGVALATAVVPTVTQLIKQGKKKELETKCNLAVKLVVVVSIFFVVFYMFFAGRIIDLLYHNAFSDNREHFRLAINLLKIESLMIALMGISQVFTAMLQAADRAKFPLIALAVGGGAKIIFELIFTATPVGIYAVSISNVICFALAAAVNTFFAIRYLPINTKPSFKTTRMILLGVGFTLCMWLTNYLLPSGIAWVLVAGGVAVVLYAISIILLQIFDKKERKVFNILR